MYDEFRRQPCTDCGKTALALAMRSPVWRPMAMACLQDTLPQQPPEEDHRHPLLQLDLTSEGLKKLHATDETQPWLRLMEADHHRGVKHFNVSSLAEACKYAKETGQELLDVYTRELTRFVQARCILCHQGVTVVRRREGGKRGRRGEGEFLGKPALSEPRRW